MSDRQEEGLSLRGCGREGCPSAHPGPASLPPSQFLPLSSVPTGTPGVSIAPRAGLCPTPPPGSALVPLCPAPLTSMATHVRAPTTVMICGRNALPSGKGGLTLAVYHVGR